MRTTEDTPIPRMCITKPATGEVKHIRSRCVSYIPTALYHRCFPRLELIMLITSIKSLQIRQAMRLLPALMLLVALQVEPCSTIAVYTGSQTGMHPVCLRCSVLIPKPAKDVSRFLV